MANAQIRKVHFYKTINSLHFPRTSGSTTEGVMYGPGSLYRQKLEMYRALSLEDVLDTIVRSLTFWNTKDEFLADYTLLQKVLKEKLRGLSPLNFENVRNRLEDYFLLQISPKIQLNNNRKAHFQSFQKLEDAHSQINEPNQVPSNLYFSLVEKISKDTVEWIQSICDKIVHVLSKTLGLPPTSFCLFTMGSLARKETGFYTDFEVGILLQENNISVQDYFRVFAQNLADCLYFLGEHPDMGGKGAHLDVADNAPIHKRFISRGLSEQETRNKIRKSIGMGQREHFPIGGSRIYLLEPENLAKLFQYEFIENLSGSLTVELNKSYRSIFYNKLNSKLLNLTYPQPEDLTNNLNKLRQINSNIEQLTPLLNLLAERLQELGEQGKRENIGEELKNQIIQTEIGSTLYYPYRFVTNYTFYEMAKALFKKYLNVRKERRQVLKNIVQTSSADSLVQSALKEIKNEIRNEALNLDISDENKKAHVKKILNPLTAREIQAIRSVRKSSRNVDFLYGFNSQTQSSIKFAQDSEIFNKFLLKRGKYLEKQIDHYKKYEDVLPIDARNNIPGDSDTQNFLHRQYISFNAIISLLNEQISSKGLFEQSNILLTNEELELPKKIDIKRQFYRIPEQILTGLYWFYKEILEAEHDHVILNSSQIIQKLRDNHVFSEEFADQFLSLITLGVKVRLKQQYKVEGGCRQAYFDQDAWQADRDDLEKKLRASQSRLERWNQLYLYPTSRAISNNNTLNRNDNEQLEEKRKYEKIVKELSYLDQVKPDKIFSEIEKELFVKGFSVLKNIVLMTEEWIKQIPQEEWVDSSRIDYQEVKVFGGNPAAIRRLAPILMLDEEPAQLIFNINQKLEQDGQ